ncbi:TPA: hypothetical protein N0F65_011572 [Lagenidium giganteum]|uniref:N-acetyltransferase domain-containing protein n=1 Tax=Lagenidium giganteum TaxID=4803 RepID=A0AAV2YKU8_9STRA|nr:TPA: hypothetical protein N0F65_011572 [Lagenidium giganteum]
MLQLSPVVMIGIAAGGVVFVGTLLAVYMLLKHGGSFDRMKHEAMGMPASANEEKALLYDELLDRAKALPPVPAPFKAALEGNRIAIRNINEKNDLAQLFRISNGSACGGLYGESKYDADYLIWKHLEVGPFNSEQQFRAHYTTNTASNGRHFVLIDREDNKPVGMFTLSHAPRHLCCQVEQLWLAPAFQGSGALTETIFVLLEHLFSLKYRRVEWRCDGHNVRARRAAHSLGFSFEGVLRKHMIIKNCNRDTVIFSVINSDWVAVQEHLHNRLRQQERKIADDKKAK